VFKVLFDKAFDRIQSKTGLTTSFQKRKQARKEIENERTERE
jgi:hypothetical protein